MAAVRVAVRRHLAAVARPGDLVLVACSGGADSLALAAATAFEARTAGLRAGLLTVDHGLQAASGAQAAEVVAAAGGLGLDPVEVLPVEVAAGPGGEGPEGAARAARFAALDAAATRLGAVAVLLGHTRDDQAETVLLGLARGSGARALAGMAGRRGRYGRPLLGLDRATTVAACAAAGLRPWEDPHNSDPAYARVRVRTEVLPLLERTWDRAWRPRSRVPLRCSATTPTPSTTGPGASTRPSRSGRLGRDGPAGRPARPAAARRAPPGDPAGRGRRRLPGGRPRGGPPAGPRRAGGGLARAGSGRAPRPVGRPAGVWQAARRRTARRGAPAGGPDTDPRRPAPAGQPPGSAQRGSGRM